MLLPNMSSTNPPNAATEDSNYEHRPHLVYVLNKSESLNKLDLSNMKNCLNTCLKDSKLAYKGSIQDQAQSSSFLLNTRQRRRNTNDWDTVNLICLPKFENENSLEFSGLPRVDRSVKNLLRDVLAVKRSNCSFIGGPSHSGQNMSEKRWFSYANKVWDTIKKSALMSEYNRLMT